jgi:hypothetical protein
MPNKIFFTSEYHTKTPAGSYIRAWKPHPTRDEDEWDITVYNSKREPVREYSGWDEVRVLAFMEFFEAEEN